MSKRKRNRLSIDASFDLFLDTITNTFGGVLLITLLIVLRITDAKIQSSESQKPSGGENPQVVQSEIEALEAEKKLLAASAHIHQSLHAEFHNKDLIALAQNLSEKISSKMDLEQKLSQLSGEARQLDFTRKGIEQKQESTSQQLATRKNDFQQLNDELTKEKQLRVRSIPLPKERETSKQEIAFIVSENELFQVETLQGNFSRTVNLNHFESASVANADLELDSKYWKTRSGNGIVIAPPQLEAAFQKHHSATYHFAFVVRSNSFASFNQIRDQCVKLGFEYRIIATDGMVSRGGSGAKTQ